MPDAALLVSNSANIRYLTGFSGVSPTEREAYVLRTGKGDLHLLTGALYKEEAKASRAAYHELSKERPLSRILADICAANHIQTLRFEDTDLTVAELTKLRSALDSITLTPTRDTIEKLRMTKTADELKHIRYAAKLTDQCFSLLLHRIKPGITEQKLALEIEAFFKYRGAENAFTPIVAFNEHSAMPHYHRRDTSPLQNGSLVLLDFGAKVNGYCADMTRVVFLGAPTDRWRAAYHAVLSANEKALSLLSLGERNGATLDAAAREVIAEADLPVYPHSLGHAVGLDIHEAPRLTVKHPETLAGGMVVTVEPATYIEGSYGIRIEDLVRLKKSGVDILSKSPKKLIRL